MVGFTLSLYEYEATIPTLWKTVKGATDMSGLLAKRVLTIFCCDEQNSLVNILSTLQKTTRWLSFQMTAAKPTITVIVSLSAQLPKSLTSIHF